MIDKSILILFHITFDNFIWIVFIIFFLALFLFLEFQCTILSFVISAVSIKKKRSDQIIRLHNTFWQHGETRDKQFCATCTSIMFWKQFCQDLKKYSTSSRLKTQCLLQTYITRDTALWVLPGCRKAEFFCVLRQCNLAGVGRFNRKSERSRQYRGPFWVKITVRRFSRI